MNSEAPVPVPRTGVPLGIDDPVERARAELKAALAAIEQKANFPRRIAQRIDATIDAAQSFTKQSPGVAIAAVVVVAGAVGAGVWAAVRAYVR
ncbi:hypothetical protein GCM10022200_23020 [Microbacterium awajiense]|uniref:DUF3618 domain-containing protein n=1 Tax=Microbacterium awajiense TaxID=415214 RepID=A0ABP7ARJ3_9MICO